MSGPEGLARHQRYLFGLCYRITGCAADADELVQDTFLRALERPPQDDTRAVRPWLARVAVNRGRDRLRARRRRGYTGPWLPSPLEEGPGLPERDVPDDELPAARYDRRESASIAFLLALEVLTPQQRAVLILRDVFDYSVDEAARALGLTPGNTKVVHHRARARLAQYEADRCRPGPELAGRHAEALASLFTALSLGEAEAVERLLSAEVRALSDGAGEFHAALRPVQGPDRVARLLLGLLRHAGPGLCAAPCTVNGLPALLLEEAPARPGAPPRSLLRCELDASGRIRELHTVLATRKLTGLAAGAH